MPTSLYRTYPVEKPTTLFNTMPSHDVLGETPSPTIENFSKFFMKNIEESNHPMTSKSKAKLNETVIAFISSSADDIPKEMMAVIAAPVASATIQIFMNLGQLSHLIDLLMHEVAKN